MTPGEQALYAYWHTQLICNAIILGAVFLVALVSIILYFNGRRK